MRNITVTVSDDIYRQARVWAAQRDTSLSAVVAYLLATLPGRKTRAETRFPLPAPVASAPADHGPAVQTPAPPEFHSSSTGRLATYAARALSTPGATPSTLSRQTSADSASK